MRERKILIAGILLIAAILSCTVGGKIASSVDTYADSIASIDKSIGDALKLTSGITASSVAISFLPGDIATPIADQFADFTDYLVFIVIILLAEKYLVTLLGMTAFRILIPASCILILVGLLSEREGLKNAGKKLIIAGVAISFLIPVSTTVSDVINDVYGSSIQETIEKADILSSNIFSDEDKDSEEAAKTQEKKKVQETPSSVQKTNDEKSTDESKFKNFFSGIGTTVSNAVGTVSNAVSNAVDSVIDSAKDAFNYFTALAKDFIESIAVMIVTSCIVPIAVLAAFVFILKLFLGIDISKVNDFPGKFKRQRQGMKEHSTESKETEFTHIR